MRINVELFVLIAALAQMSLVEFSVKKRTQSALNVVLYREGFYELLSFGLSADIPQ